MSQPVIRLVFHPSALRVEVLVDELHWDSFFSEGVEVSLLVTFNPSIYLPPPRSIISS